MITIFIIPKSNIRFIGIYFLTTSPVTAIDVTLISRIHGSCKITTWLCAIAKNQYLSYLRKHPMHEDLTDADASTIDFLKENAQAELKTILENGIGQN